MSDFNEYQSKLLKARESGNPAVSIKEVQSEVGNYSYIGHYDAEGKFITGCMRNGKGAFVSRLMYLLP